jgi:hypothetical protein
MEFIKAKWNGLNTKGKLFVGVVAIVVIVGLVQAV